MLIQAILRLDVSYTIQVEEVESTINERKLVLEFADRLGFEARSVVPASMGWRCSQGRTSAWSRVSVGRNSLPALEDVGPRRTPAPSPVAQERSSYAEARGSEASRSPLAARRRLSSGLRERDRARPMAA